MCDCDENPAIAFNAIHCKARKIHRCCECRREIPVGGVYQRITGIWQEGPATFKTCLACAVKREEISLLALKIEECVPCFGGLRDYIFETTGERWPPADSEAGVDQAMEAVK